MLPMEAGRPGLLGQIGVSEGWGERWDPSLQQDWRMSEKRPIPGAGGRYNLNFTTRAPVVGPTGDGLAQRTSDMAKAGTRTATNPNLVIADGEPLDLRNRHLAALLGWIFPGVGHFYQRRYFKGTVFSLCVLSSFLIGMVVAHGKCVYAAWNNVEHRWQFALQAGVGFVAIPAAIQAWSGRGGNPPLLGDAFLVGPKSTADLDRWNAETASGFDMGTLYTMVAGLLNILAVYDAHAGPLPPPMAKPPEKKKGRKRAGEDAPDQGDAHVD